MATIKSYTDINQSRKLAEILPIESADKHWIILDGAILCATTYDYFNLQEYNQNKDTFREYIPCWSLAALLSILHSSQNGIPSLSGSGYRDGNYTLDWYLNYEYDNGNYQNTFADNPIDACYEMIIKLHELDLL